MTRYFYSAPRAHHAYAMAIDFGMQFKKRNGLWTAEGLPHLRGTNYEIEVADESLHLLVPAKGDLIRWHNPNALDAHVHRIKHVESDEPMHPSNKLLEIIQRNGIAFHWPDIEP